MGFVTSLVMGGIAAVQAERARRQAKKDRKRQKEELAKLEAEGPPATPTTEGADLRKRFARRSSRRKTIVTGDLAPASTGKRSLLG